MHFPKLLPAILAMAFNLPDVVAVPSSLDLSGRDSSAANVDLNVRGVKISPIMKPKPQGSGSKYVVPEPDTDGSDKPAQTTQKPAQTTRKTTQPTQKADSNTPVTQQPQTFKGLASYYYQNERTGKCGKLYQDGDFVVALDNRRFDMSLCDKKIRVVSSYSKRVVDVTVVDSTDGGNDENWLDLSLAAFKQISSLENGVESVTWNII
ncbi:barwin-like endoglucanase [Fusarium longipes]|uniref:Barwin-like endoglucanase n=1 Tax=Fusarium longipes TaxID=694270 RepID=A0A395SJ36_9HYPO|nr:barwin-like endoglucanase [Fusarium longipes]